MTEEGSGDSARLVLQRHRLRPRKSLGQNFLRDRRYLAAIVDALDLSAEDEVLEIGPGTGVLTARLTSLAHRVVAVELDPYLATALRAEFPSSPNLEIVAGDALKFHPAHHFDGTYKLAGNIPYYITGPLLRHYLELPRPPAVMALMVQKEVAERIVAEPGNLSLLGVSVQFHGHPSIVARVPRRAFHPVPKVDSAVLRIVPHEPPLPPDLRPEFFRLVRAGFGTKRKTLRNALAIGLDLHAVEAEALLARASIDSRRRAETLRVEDWVRLTLTFRGRND